MRPPPSTRPGTRKKGAAHRLRGWDSDQARLHCAANKRGSAPSPVKRGAEMGRPRSPLQWEAIGPLPCAQGCGTCLIYRKSFKGCSVIMTTSQRRELRLRKANFRAQSVPTEKGLATMLGRSCPGPKRPLSLLHACVHFSGGGARAALGKQRLYVVYAACWGWLVAHGNY